MMKTVASVPVCVVLLAAFAVGGASSQTACYGASSESFDTWCNVNCNHDPPYCPSQYCSCDTSPSPSPPSSGDGGTTCTAVSLFISDAWCELLCNYDPPFCPAVFCTCDSPVAEEVITIEYHQPSCCELDIKIAYIENSHVYLQTVDYATKEAIGEPTVCGQFLGPSDLEFDADGNIYVADPVAATLTRFSPDCQERVLVTSWTGGGPIDAPTGITVAHGGLYVSGKEKLYFVTLMDNFKAGDITHVLDDQISSMDRMNNDTIFFIEHGARVMKYYPATKALEVFFDINEYRIPDIYDIKVTSCGVFFSVTDSNQIWWCPDPEDGTSCSPYCFRDTNTLDSSSCTYMNNPHGIAIDCECGIYSTQRGNGNLLYHTYTPDMNLQNSTLVDVGLYHTVDIEIFVPPECSPSPSSSRTPSTSRSPTVSISESRSSSPTMSSSESNTASVSASLSSSLTASPSASLTASPSASPSSTASPSSSSSSSPSPSSSLSASPTSSATASLSASPTSSLSASPTATSSLSASPTATSSLSASPSASLTASITPSITPSPSALFSLAVGIDDYNTECAVGECGYDTNIALNEAETSRKFGVFVYITDVRASTEDTSDCFSTDLFQTTPVLLISCQRLVDPSTYVEPFDAEYSAAFRVYIRTTSTGVSSSGLPPTYRTPVGVFAPSTFPNASPNTILAGQLECIGFEGQRARLVWHDPRPCWNDAKFPSANTCTPTRSTPVSDASSYVNTTAGASMTQPGLYPFHEVFCPLD